MNELLEFFRNTQNSILINTAIFLLGGVCGFFVSRFTLTKAQRVENQRCMADRAASHSRELEKRYIEFCDALRAYITFDGEPTLDCFYRISITGDLYFSELKVLCDAILMGSIDAKVAKRTFAPKICEALEKNIFQYYDTLQSISKKIHGTYSGKFERKNYLSIIEVAEKYGTTKGYDPFC